MEAKNKQNIGSCYITFELKIHSSWKDILKAKVLGTKAIDKIADEICEKIRESGKNENKVNT